MKWPGRDSPGKGRFPAWHRADPSCQQDSGTITGSPALGPGGDPPQTPSAAGGRVVPQHLLTPPPCRGDTPAGDKPPLFLLCLRSQLCSFCIKAPEGERNRTTNGALGRCQPRGTAVTLGRWGPTAPRSHQMAGAGVRAPLAARQHNAGPSAGHHSASAPGPGLQPPPPHAGTVRFCAVPALSLGKFTVLMLMVPGSSGLAGEAVTGRASGAHTASV